MTNELIINSTGISGSLTNLADGTSYLVAGDGINIVSQSNGSVVVSTTSVTPTTASFGDGSDGNVTVSSNTTLSRDMYYASLAISSGVTLTSAGYRIFVQGQCTITGTIDNSGGQGQNAGGGQPGAGGAGGAAGTMGGGGAGGGFSPSAVGGFSLFGVAGVNAAGGAGYEGADGGTYYPVWTMPTASNPSCVQDVLSTIVDTTNIDCRFFTGGAGGGCGKQGGGAGGGGVIVLIASGVLITSTGVISANGGAQDVDGWGGGGAGGLIIVVTDAPLINSGSIEANSGSMVDMLATPGGMGAVFTYQI